MKAKECISCGGKCFAKGENPLCRPCFNILKTKRIPRRKYARNWTLNKKYGVSSEEFDNLLVVFKNQCAICSKQLVLPVSGQGQPRNAAVLDHNHKTGNIRGILCNSCNKALGLFDDNIDFLEKAVGYLK